MAGAKGGRRVLITGMAGDLAGMLAARLDADPRVAAVTGIDVAEPRHDLGRTEFVRADLRGHEIAGVLESTGADTLVHLALTALPAAAGGRARMKELNVIGTMQLLAAAQKLPPLRTVVTKSTTAVYGSSSADPALFREDVAPAASSRSGYARDAVEVEGYVRAFGRRRPDVTLTILRFANFIGPTLDTVFSRYLNLPVVPTVLGFDPRVQLCHETDAVELLWRACTGDHPGIYNAAGPGIVYLSQAVRLAGRPTVAVPRLLVNAVADVVRRSGRVDVAPDQLQFLRYGRVGDISRMRDAFGYEPRFSTRAALEDAIAHGRITRVVERDAARQWERRVYAALSGERHPPAPSAPEPPT